VPLYLEDFAPGQVRESPPRTLTKDEIIAFAREYDPQPFHVDERAAKESVYGGLIASGWQTIGIMMRLMWDAFLKDTVSLGSPGCDEIRWLKPVRPGDTLRARFTITGGRAVAQQARPRYRAHVHRDPESARRDRHERARPRHVRPAPSGMSRGAPRFAGALRTLGVWGHLGAPMFRQASERHGLAGALPSIGGVGPFRGPHVGW